MHQKPYSLLMIMIQLWKYIGGIFDTGRPRLLEVGLVRTGGWPIGIPDTHRRDEKDDLLPQPMLKKKIGRSTTQGRRPNDPTTSGWECLKNR